MNSSERSWPALLQRSIFGWVVGGSLLLGSAIGLSMLIMSVVGSGLQSHLVALATLLYYGFLFGSFAAAHGFILVAFLGLLILPFQPIRYKLLTLAVSALGLIATLQVLMRVYFDRPFLWG